MCACDIVMSPPTDGHLMTQHTHRIVLALIVGLLITGCDTDAKNKPTDTMNTDVPELSDSADADTPDDAVDVDTSQADGDDLDVDMGTPPPPFSPRNISGQWWAGDFHVHATGASNDTGGDSLPEDIAMVAQQRGLDFVVLTDHSNSTGSDPSTTDEDPLLFNMGP